MVWLGVVHKMHQPTSDVKIAIIGHGRSGKDTVAELLAKQTGLRFDGSISWCIKERVADVLGVSSCSAWENRHKNREQWRKIIDDFRKDDPGCVIRDILCHADIIAGIRARAEFEATKHLFKHVIWVERSVPPDPTLELTHLDATSYIHNTGAMRDLEFEVSAWSGRYL